MVAATANRDVVVDGTGNVIVAMGLLLAFRDVPSLRGRPGERQENRVLWITRPAGAAVRAVSGRGGVRGGAGRARGGGGVPVLGLPERVIRRIGREAPVTDTSV
ncbi:hypothetical protein GCM10023088_04350 [Actinomadura verrucosospora]